MIIWIAGAVLLLVVLFGAYVRLAPSDPLRWHVDPQVTRNQDLPNGVRRLQPTWPDGLARLDGIIMSGPRTRWLAGSVRAGMVTYVTRSAFWGFPDYTTVLMADGKLEIWARSRFGTSDMGVNKARVDGWLKVLIGDDD
ncbi:DUF1499 domain-containing protein [Pseudooceanicola pacificus]|nr:DUF1499 domain-containing protein [Pseudooceanicola pacificus]